MMTHSDPDPSGATRRGIILGATLGAVAAGAAKAATALPQRKNVGVVLYPNFEVLDVFGPVEMWGNVPDLKVVFVAQAPGPVKSAQGVSVLAEHGFDSPLKLDVMMVPGGMGTITELKNEALLAYLKAQDAGTTLTTSVCTGSALLAKAGLLEGRRATTNKKYFSIASSLPAKVTWVKHARWVEDGKYITSSGVSAGTDMALGVVAKLHGVDQARLLARTLEYQWSEDPGNDPFAIA